MHREGIKAIYVGEQAKIIKGINKGKKGKVIMADAETNAVKLQINDQMETLLRKYGRNR